MDLINLLLNPKMHIKTHIYFLFSYEITKQYDFLYIFLRDLTMCNTQKTFFFYLLVSWNKNMLES